MDEDRIQEDVDEPLPIFLILKIQAGKEGKRLLNVLQAEIRTDQHLLVNFYLDLLQLPFQLHVSLLKAHELTTAVFQHLHDVV